MITMSLDLNDNCEDINDGSGMLDETEVSKPSYEGCPDVEQTDKLGQPNDNNGLQNQEKLEVKSLSFTHSLSLSFNS